MNEHELSYFHLEEEGVNLKLKKGADIVQVAQAAMPAAAAPATQATTNETPAAEPAGNDITAPMVGTFYASPSPDSPPFVNVGDTINEGQTICIIEAMKVMNEIQSELNGEIVEILAEDGDSVEYSQPLYKIRKG